MKDKRGITTQFCTAYRVEKEQLLAVNATGAATTAGKAAGGGHTAAKGAAIIRLGNFAYSDKEIRLGTLSGNRFDIVLRNIDAGEGDGSAKTARVRSKLDAAGRALRELGFINYFGMQRFGKSHNTHEVGIAVLKGDFEAAVGVVMAEKADEPPRVLDARRQWARRFDAVDPAEDEDAAKARAEAQCAGAIQRDLGRFNACETSIVHALARQPRNYQRAFGSIGKNSRSMFVHAYQSYLWSE